MSMAIKYAMMKKNKMAEGGMCEHGSMDCHMCHGGKMMAEGGFVGEEEESGYRSMPKDREKYNSSAVMEDDHDLDQKADSEEMMDDEDMVGRIMKHRMKGYSKGGMVANDTPATADFEDNDFDDLANRDDLESSYTGANSGDEIGDDQEDMDRRDIVSKIMKSRRLKDRMPRPAWES